MAQKHRWDCRGIQVAFSVFIALETWFTPIHGWIADKLGPTRGPRLVVALGGLLVAIGWVINSYADSLSMLYFGAVVSGIGGGAVYAVLRRQRGEMVRRPARTRRRPDRSRLRRGRRSHRHPDAHGDRLGGLRGRVLLVRPDPGRRRFLVGWLLRGPLPGEAPVSASTAKVVQSTRSFSPGEMLTTPTFWLLYLMFVLISASGLMATRRSR